MYKEALYEFEKIASVLSSEDLEVYANEVLAELEKEAGLDTVIPNMCIPDMCIPDMCIPDMMPNADDIIIPASRNLKPYIIGAGLAAGAGAAGTAGYLKYKRSKRDSQGKKASTMLEEFEKIASILNSEDLEIYANEVLAELEKEAMARRYKAVIGELSPDSLKRLTQPQPAKVKLSRGEAAAATNKNYMKKDYNIHDYRREADGLNTGSDILAQKHGLTVKDFTPEEFADAVYPDIINNPVLVKLLKGQLGNAFSEQAVKDMLKQGHKASGGYFSAFSDIPGKKLISVGDIDRPDSVFKQVAAAANVTIPRKGTVGRDYVDASLKRHEINENIGTVAARKNKKLSMGDSPDPDKRLQTTQFASHGTPRVLMHESADIAGAPPEAREFMEGLRTHTGEVPVMETVFDHSYGRSGIFDKKTARRAEKIMDIENRPMLEMLLGP